MNGNDLSLIKVFDDFEFEFYDFELLFVFWIIFILNLNLDFYLTFILKNMGSYVMAAPLSLTKSHSESSKLSLSFFLVGISSFSLSVLKELQILSGRKIIKDQSVPSFFARIGGPAQLAILLDELNWVILNAQQLGLAWRPVEGWPHLFSWVLNHARRECVTLHCLVLVRRVHALWNSLCYKGLLRTSQHWKA